MEFSSQKILFVSYFVTLIFLGSLLLALPVSWNGSGSLAYSDALFTATSSVCVTGLITKGTEQFSSFGQGVILALIQFGGLGIITFTTAFLALPRARVSFRSISLVKKYYIDTVEFKSHHIVRSILFATVLIESTGFFLLYRQFNSTGVTRPVFTALFHTISAFCNAGFSTFPDSMIRFSHEKKILSIIMVLIFLGGIGFVVLDDIRKKILFRKRLSLYSKIALGTSLSLVLIGAAFYYFSEANGVFSGLPIGQKVINSFFQSVTTRTAGFNSVEENDMRMISKVFTIPLMLIGGSSGSIAGGIKVSTFFILVAVIIFGVNSDGEMRIGNRKIDRNTIAHAFIFFGKAVFLLFFSTLLLVISETVKGKGFSFLEMFYEVVSAFGTVGLSLGITGKLSLLGKIVIIFTMFAGRVGLVTMAISIVERKEVAIDVPSEEVLIG